MNEEEDIKTEREKELSKFKMSVNESITLLANLMFLIDDIANSNNYDRNSLIPFKLKVIKELDNIKEKLEVL